MALNPVEQRLAELCNEWVTFRADTSKRLLIWQAPDNAARLIQCFFETQKHETDYTTGDLFIVFDIPFVHSIQYSRSLKEALAGHYEASREDLAQQGITPGWDFAPGLMPDSAAGFVGGLRSFEAAHKGHFGRLVAVLMPRRVSDAHAFTAWLSRALGGDLPERLRFLVVDSLETPILTGLGDPANSLAQVRRLRIDALAIAQETFAREGGTGPGAVFRNHLMSVAALVEKGSANQVRSRANDALAFARKEKWADQEVVLAVLVAGALLKEKRFDEAAHTYRDARQAALRADETGHPSGQPLVLQTWFGEAGVHLAAGRSEQAAACYDGAAVAAWGSSNPILAIEALRMSAFCRARTDNRQEAVERARGALILGRQMQPGEREMSTLPIAAVDLLRIIEPARVTDMENVKRRLLEQTEQARLSVEVNAAALEAEGRSDRLAEEERTLEQSTALAERAAAAELDDVVARSSKEFRMAFADGRELLGPQWPLFFDMALPLPQATQADEK